MGVTAAKPRIGALRHDRALTAPKDHEWVYRVTLARAASVGTLKAKHDHWVHLRGVAAGYLNREQRDSEGDPEERPLYRAINLIAMLAAVERIVPSGTPRCASHSADPPGSALPSTSPGSVASR